LPAGLILQWGESASRSASKPHRWGVKWSKKKSAEVILDIMQERLYFLGNGDDLDR
jgi:hypothetical protein